MNKYGRWCVYDLGPSNSALQGLYAYISVMTGRSSSVSLLSFKRTE